MHYTSASPMTMDRNGLPYGWGHGDRPYLADSTGMLLQQPTVGQPYTPEPQEQDRIPWAEKGYTSQAPTQWSASTSSVGSYNQPLQYSQHVPSLPTSTGTVSPTAIFGEFSPPEVSFPNTTYSTPDISRGITPDRRADDLLCQILLDSGVWSGPHREPMLEAPNRSRPSPHVTSAPIIHSTRRSGHGKPLKRTRIAQACEPCRKRKHKCSGSIGGKKCARCQSKKLGCVFAPTPAHPDGSQTGHKKQKPNDRSEPDSTPEYIEEATNYQYPEPKPDKHLELDYGNTNTSTNQYQAPILQSESSSSSSTGTRSVHYDPDVISYPAPHPDLSQFNALGLSNPAQGPQHFNTSTYQPPPTNYYYGSSNATIPVYQPDSATTVPHYNLSGDTTQAYSVPSYQNPYSGYYDYTTSASTNGNGLLMSQLVDNVSETSFGSTPRSSEAILSPWEYPLSAPREMSYLATYTHNQPF